MLMTGTAMKCGANRTLKDWVRQVRVRSQRPESGERSLSAAVHAEVDQRPVPAPNRVMDQGRRHSGLRPCVKKYGRYGEIRELWCFDVREASS